MDLESHQAPDLTPYRATLPWEAAARGHGQSCWCCWAVRGCGWAVPSPPPPAPHMSLGPSCSSAWPGTPASTTRAVLRSSTTTSGAPSVTMTSRWATLTCCAGTWASWLPPAGPTAPSTAKESVREGWWAQHPPGTAPQTAWGGVGAPTSLQGVQSAWQWLCAHVGTFCLSEQPLGEVETLHLQIPHPELYSWHFTGLSFVWTCVVPGHALWAPSQFPGHAHP